MFGFSIKIDPEKLKASKDKPQAKGKKAASAAKSEKPEAEEAREGSDS